MADCLITLRDSTTIYVSVSVSHSHTPSLCGLFLIIAEGKGGDKDQGEAHFPQHHGRSVNCRMLPVP